MIRITYGVGDLQQGAEVFPTLEAARAMLERDTEMSPTAIDTLFRTGSTGQNWNTYWIRCTSEASA
jgi:hypothetical protein